jgi:hypothetical protein
MVASQASDRREGADMRSIHRSILTRTLMTGAASLAVMMASGAGTRAEIVTVQGDDGLAGADGVNPGDDGLPGGGGESVSTNAGSAQPITVPLNKATATGGNGGAGGNGVGDGNGGAGGHGGAANATAATTIASGSAEADASSFGGGGGPGGLGGSNDGDGGAGSTVGATSTATNATRLSLTGRAALASTSPSAVRFLRPRPGG